MSRITVQQVRTKLAEGLHQIVFTKDSGEIRTLVGTLHPGFLPSLPTDEDKTKTKRAPKPDVVSVYVPDLAEWRSFKIDSLISLHPIGSSSSTKPIPAVPIREFAVVRAHTENVGSWEVFSRGLPTKESAMKFAKQFNGLSPVKILIVEIVDEI